MKRGGQGGKYHRENGDLKTSGGEERGPRNMEGPRERVRARLMNGDLEVRG